MWGGHAVQLTDPLTDPHCPAPGSMQGRRLCSKQSSTSLDIVHIKPHRDCQNLFRSGMKPCSSPAHLCQCRLTGMPVVTAGLPEAGLPAPAWQLA